jgi:predicted DNA-binding transcriptional regulator AlpA
MDDAFKDSGSSPPPASTGTRLLSTAMVAETLGVAVQTLAAWRCAGRGPKFVKLGTGTGARIAYRESDVEAWVASLPTFASTLDEKASPALRSVS